MDRQGNEGLQSSPHNVDDRKPALNSRAARLLDTLEQRLTRLEARNAMSPHHTSPSSTSVAAEMDFELARLNAIYAALEDQVATLTDNYAIMEKTIQPYHEYTAKAVATVQQLQALQDTMRNVQMEFSASELKNRFAAHDEALELLSSELQEVRAANVWQRPPVSTRDVARTLLERLKHGDVLDDETACELRLAIDEGDINGTTTIKDKNGSPATHVQKTPLNDKSSFNATASTRSKQNSANRKGDVETTFDEAESDGPSTKRRRATKSLYARKSRSSLDQAQQATDQLMAETIKQGTKIIDQPVSHVAEAKKAAALPSSEPRKSGRKPRPKQGYGGEIHWDFADTSVRGFRHSLD
ncbi:Hypothetical protein R9X50_00092600 [Acrodontium crateriforme]|uniref:Uncharacterized protein n=1 Tax=Acrodontium crateriforme TaxID=150365 RepID=A0AAQ3R7F4_9PEZI|nr:Hypothetical protein R9X50_00092600 [Acrodontium crateriforme]